ncbi:MAG: ROK family protein [Ktedonobacteraceae bacterium]
MKTENGMPYEASEHLPLVVAVDLGGTQIRTAVLRGAKLLSRVGLLTGEHPIPERIFPRIFQAIQQALINAEVSLEQIAGIGVGAPGPLNSRTGIVYAPPNLPGWENVPVRELFSQQFHVPIFVENDANAAALGEYMFGAGRGSRDMVYLTISTGIGGGVITDGKLLEGASGTAAELGHMTVDWHGERCNCGNIGCLECIASGTGIARRANDAIAHGQGDDLLAFALEHQSNDQENAKASTSGDGAVNTLTHVTARNVALAAAAGIPLARAIIATAAEALGIGFVNIIHIFNPEKIILGGGVTQMGALLLDPAIRLVEERTMLVPRKAAHIVLAELGHDVGLVGAGALIYYYNEGIREKNREHGGK